MSPIPCPTVHTVAATVGSDLWATCHLSPRTEHMTFAYGGCWAASKFIYHTTGFRSILGSEYSDLFTRRALSNEPRDPAGSRQTAARIRTYCHLLN